MHTPLGFTVRLAAGAADLRDACQVRAQAYGRHLPQMRSTLVQPDALDAHPGTAILVCRDKHSGQAIGTLRLQRACAGPLQIEHSAALPEALLRRSRAELTRLAVMPGADPLVRPMLMKASYLWCLASQVRWMVIGARSDALIRIYRHLGFVDVFGEDERVPLAHAGGLPHRVLAFDVTAAERTWLAAGHGLYPLMIETFHPDLDLFSPPASTVRRAAQAA